MHEEMQKLLHEQVESLQALHALNQMMDKELDMLIAEAQRKITEAAEKGADSWYQESNPAKAEHHKHQTHFEAKKVKHNLIRTIHTRLHGQVNLEGIHPEHTLERLQGKLKKQLKAEGKRLHSKVKDLQKQISEHHKNLSKEDAALYTPLLKKTKELHEQIRKQSLPQEKISQELEALPSMLYTPFLHLA